MRNRNDPGLDAETLARWQEEAKLTDAEVEVLHLRCVEGLADDEIARHLHLTLSAVRARASRGFAALLQAQREYEAQEREAQLYHPPDVLRDEEELTRQRFAVELLRIQRGPRSSAPPTRDFVQHPQGHLVPAVVRPPMVQPEDVLDGYQDSWRTQDQWAELMEQPEKLGRPPRKSVFGG